MSQGDQGTIALAERILGLLEEGSFSATYKYALLTAILDLCIERTSESGVPPTSLTTLQLAHKITELYWPHAAPYSTGRVLRQGGSGNDSQAEIVRAIADFRESHAGTADELLFRARIADPDGYERLIRRVEWKLIEMPIPRLQVLGTREDRFLYEYGWTQAIRQGEISRYQRGDKGVFDNQLLLKPAVGERLMRLNGILRPLLQHEWSMMVCSMNGLPEGELQEFLFGRSRIPLDPVRAPLLELQRGLCFYCEERVRSRCDVDHFLPWSRYPDDGLDNLVVAHESCNNRKRDFLAADSHLERWVARLKNSASALDSIATDQRWRRDPRTTRAVARALYTRLPDDAPLWLRGREFIPLRRDRLATVFGLAA